MGADKQELDPEVLRSAGRVACLAQHAAGEGRNAPIELGELTSGRTPGRQSAEEITVCDLTGTGVQDTAIASLALTRARALGAGIVIDN